MECFLWSQLCFMQLIILWNGALKIWSAFFISSFIITVRIGNNWNYHHIREMDLTLYVWSHLLKGKIWRKIYNGKYLVFNLAVSVLSYHRLSFGWVLFNCLGREKINFELYCQEFQLYIFILSQQKQYLQRIQLPHHGVPFKRILPISLHGPWTVLVFCSFLGLVLSPVLPPDHCRNPILSIKIASM